MGNERQEARENEVYEFRVHGELDPGWSEWFEGFEIAAAGGETTLRGPVSDQAALYGLISKFRNLGLVLLSVNIVSPAVPRSLPFKG